MQCVGTIRILPELDKQVSWFPFDCAAKTIVELVNLGWYFCNAVVIACISALIVHLRWYLLIGRSATVALSPTVTITVQVDCRHAELPVTL